MMISSPAAGDPYAAAAALDRSLRASSNPFSTSTDGVTPDASPDVVVTLGQSSQAPATYDASGKLPSTPKSGDSDDGGVDAPDSLTQATEADGDDATSAAPAASTTSESSQDASADADSNTTEDAAATA